MLCVETLVGALLAGDVDLLENACGVIDPC